MALLHLLVVSGHRVTAAHLNHCLRGRESNRDENFVRVLCREWDIPLRVGREAVAARSRQNRLSIEEAARIARYRFLAQAAKCEKIRKIVVAHHQHDQAETVLLKFFRGAGRRQLKGMEMSRPMPMLGWRPQVARRKTGLKLIRPLLDAPHGEIVLYARQNRLPFREDSSNRDLSRSRNWIRHRLLPLIERRLNRNVVKTLAGFGR